MNACWRVVEVVAEPLIADLENVDSLHELRSWPERNPNEIFSQIAFVIRSETSDLGGLDAISEHSGRVIARKLGVEAERVVELPAAECGGVFHEMLGDMLYRALNAQHSKLLADLHLLGFKDVYYAKRAMFHLMFAYRVSLD
jgi:hypothetical protein